MHPGSTSSTRPCAATSPTTSPGSPGGEKTAAAAQHLRLARRHLRPRRRADPKLRENLAAHEEQVRLNAEVMVLVRDVDVSCDRGGHHRRRRSRRRSAALRLPRVPGQVRTARRGPRWPPGQRRHGGGGRGGAEVLEAELTEVDTAEAAAVLLGRLAAGDGRSPSRRRGRAPRSVGPGGPGRRRRRRHRRGRLAGRRPPRRRRHPCRADGPARRRRPAAGGHGAKALMRRLGEDGVDVRLAPGRHDARRLPARPGRGPATCSATCSCATRTSSFLTTPPAAEASSTSTAARWPLARGCPAGAGGRPLGGPAVRTRSTSRACVASSDDIEVPLVRVLAKMEEVGVAVDRGELEASTPPSSRSAPAHRADQGGRRGGLQRQLHAPTTRDPVRQARVDPAEEDQDRLLHGRVLPSRSCSASTRSSSTCCATGGREAALHLRRGPARRGRRRRAHPRHLQPDRRPHRSAQLDAPTCTTSRCAPRVGLPPGLRPRPRLRLPRRRLQPDRAALHRPPGRGPGPRRRLRERLGHPANETASRVFGVDPAG